MKLKMELDKIVKKDIDSIIIFKARNNRWMEKEMWALVEDKLDNFIWLSTYNNAKIYGVWQKAKISMVIGF